MLAKWHKLTLKSKKQHNTNKTIFNTKNNKKMTFTTYYDGKSVLFSNTNFDREQILKELIASELGEISIGYYRFVLIEY